MKILYKKKKKTTHKYFSVLHPPNVHTDTSIQIAIVVEKCFNYYYHCVF